MTSPAMGTPARRRSIPRQPAFDLLDQLRDEVEGIPILSPAKFIRIMNLDVNTFAVQARVHRNTVNNSPASMTVQSHLQANVRVLRAAFDVFGDMKNAIFWYRNEPLPPFDYKTPHTLVTEGRADDVIHLLESYASGFVG